MPEFLDGYRQRVIEKAKAKNPVEQYLHLGLQVLDEDDIDIAIGEKCAYSDFSTGRLNSKQILGKGRYGGKPRQMNWHPDTPGILEEYPELRDKEIAKAKRKNPGVEIPPNLPIYEAGGISGPTRRALSRSS